MKKNYLRILALLFAASPAIRLGAGAERRDRHQRRGHQGRAEDRGRHEAHDSRQHASRDRHGHLSARRAALSLAARWPAAARSGAAPAAAPANAQPACGQQRAGATGPNGIYHDSTAETYIVTSGSGTLITGGTIVNGRRSPGRQRGDDDPQRPVVQRDDGGLQQPADQRRRHHRDSGRRAARLLGDSGSRHLSERSAGSEEGAPEGIREPGARRKAADGRRHDGSRCDSGTRLPTFEVDRTWPKVPAKWKLGDVSSFAIDAQDNVWLLHRPRTLLKPEDVPRRRRR